jgi:colicin import membrane protein
MNPSNRGTSKVSWFWGIVLSLSLHVMIFSLAIFWGFGSPKQLEEAESIEGRLVSPSELEQSLKVDTGPGQKEEKVKPPPPEKPEIHEEPKKAEVKEEPKKTELKREEPPPKVEEEKPKDAIALETKKKKQVAEIPKPTVQPRVPPKEVEKPKEPSFKDVKNKVLEDMRKVRKEEDKEKERQRVLSEIEKKKVLRDIEEGRVAEVNTSDQERGTGRGSTSYNRQSPGARATLGALFINRVREEIKGNWRIPENVPVDGSLRTVVVFRIDEGGRVHDVKVEKSSGNPAFDDYCVKAIYRASPLTPPPSELLEEAKTDGVEVPFTNDQS